MYGIAPLAFFLSFCVAVLATAEPIEIFYFSDQETYTVAGFKEDGIPILEESADEVPEFTGVRDGTWHVRGKLDLSPEFAMPMIDYELTRRPKSYLMQGQDDRYDVQYGLWGLFASRPWIPKQEGALLVIAWLYDGQLDRFKVAPLETRSTASSQADYLSKESAKGMPLCWLVKDGQLLPKVRSLAFDSKLLAGDGELSAEVLALADGKGRSLVHYLAANGLHRSLGEVIAYKRQEVRRKGQGEKLPLSYAAKNGRDECVRLLMEAKSPLVDGWEGMSVIAREAAKNGHRVVVLQLTASKKGKDSVWQRSWALASASNNRYTDIVEDLFEKKVSLSIPKEKRPESILKIFSDGYPDLGFLLLDYFKVKPKVATVDGYNLFHAVSGYADAELLEKIRGMGVDMLSPNQSELLPLDIAIGRGNVNGICWFLENGGRPEGGGSGKIDPFKQAIQNGQLESVSCLISYGYDVNDEIAQDFTPLMYSVYARHLGIAESILEAGGVWELEHDLMDLLMLRVLEADGNVLLESLLDQGWPKDRLVFGELPVEEAARFYGAENCREVLDTRGFEGAGERIKSIGSVETKPRLVSQMSIDYPERLQEKYGSINPLVKGVVGPQGNPLMLTAGDDSVPGDVFPVLEKAFYSLVFEPARIGEEAVPVVMKFRIPLKAVFSEKDTEVFGLQDVDEKPRAVQMSTPLYPYSLQQAGAKGRVVVEFILGPDGEVYRARAEYYTHEAFRDQAVACVRRTVWEPAKKDGVPVACRVKIPIHFTP